MTPDELIEGHTWLISEIYDEAQYTRRKRHYVDIMKNLSLPWLDRSGETLSFFQ